MKHKLQVKDITQLTGIDRETLRFYEMKGLLPKPERSQAGYRQYSPDVVVRLKFIKLAQDVGFSLKQINELLNLGQKKAMTQNDLKKVAQSKIAEIDQRINKLQDMRRILSDLSARPINKSEKQTCPILSQLNFIEG